jgi:beta-fructofuranosidase
VSNADGPVTPEDRPRLHLSPPSGWLNDPNGLIFHDGLLHAFYQHEPNMPRWGRMCWGHATSRDLVTWEHLPVALEPGRRGPDRAGCWSGTLVEDDRGVPTIFYTGVVRSGGSWRASICRATSDDGLRTWTKDPAGPVIDRPPDGIAPDRFRDPFVWRDDQGWAMLLAAGTVRSRGSVALYRSEDLRDWRYAGPFLTTEDVIAADPEVFVDDIDSPCWECPQLLRLGSWDVLIVSVVDRAPTVRPAHVVAFTGRVEADRFVVHRAERLGLGPDFYAPATVTAPDGRHLLFGWIPEDPPGRGSARTWAGSLTLPRDLSMDPGGRLKITLAEEVDRRAGPPRRLPEVIVRDDAPWTQGFVPGPFELRLSIAPEGAVSIRFDIAGEAGIAADVRFDPPGRQLTVSRSGRVLVAGRDPHGPTTLPPSPDGLVHMRLIVDGSILELAVDERVTATARLPVIGGGARTISCTTFGGACRLQDLETFTLDGTEALAGGSTQVAAAP